MRLDPNIRYACVQCGKSCQRPWNIWLEAGLPERLTSQLKSLPVAQDEAFHCEEGRTRLARNERGCRFLQDNLCSIHKQLGYASKPLQCQQYPFLFTEAPDGMRVSASYTCTAVLQEAGPPLEEHRALLVDCLAQGATVKKIESSPHWPAIQAFESLFESAYCEWGWDDALRRAVRTMLAGRVANRGGTPAEWWYLHEGVQLSQEDGYGWVLGALLKPCLSQHQSQLWLDLDRALLESGPLEIPEFDYRGTASEILDWAHTPLPDERELSRFRRSLWFRREHLLCGGLFAGMLMLWTVGPLYRLLARLSSSHAALERLDLNLLAHSYIAQQIYPMICDYWIGTYRSE